MFLLGLVAGLALPLGVRLAPLPANDPALPFDAAPGSAVTAQAPAAPAQPPPG